jgi:hypothetical protein
MNPTINADDLTYQYQEYDKGVLGKCAEFPAITAQGKSREQVCSLLHEMVKDYFELKKSKNL